MNSIKNILRARAEIILVALGLLFAGSIAWILIWGVAVLAKDLGASLGAPKVQYAGDSFKLKEASGLDFRGLE